jgi:hypothetical protein
MGSLSPGHDASSGGGWREVLQIQKVVANILNKQLTRGGPQGWGLGVGLTNSLHKNFLLLRNVSKRLDN